MNSLLACPPHNSIFHRIDPRVKLLLLVSNLLVIIFLPNIQFLTLNLIVIILITKLAKIDLKTYKPLLKVMIFISLQFIIFQSLFNRGGEVLFSLGFIRFYKKGIYLGVLSALRLLNLALVFLQFLILTTPGELVAMGAKFGLPHKYSVLIGMTLCFLPIVESDLKSIYESQQARGLELSTTFQKIKGLFPIIMPLILRSLKRTKEIALSMELKGYGLYNTRTILHEISFSKEDLLATIAIVIYNFLCIFILL